MNRLSFERDFDSNNDDKVREARTIAFDLSENLTLPEFFVVCKRMAAAIGYAPGNIKTVFGADPDDFHVHKKNLLRG